MFDSLKEQRLLMNPFVLSELLSSPKLPQKTEKHLLELPRLKLSQGFFERCGLLRRKIYKSGKGISIAGIYIAQSCIDAEIPLLTVDQDLKLIARHSVLSLVACD